MWEHDINAPRPRPCPNCAAEGKIALTEDVHCLVFVECHTCRARGPACLTPALAVHGWNADCL